MVALKVSLGGKMKSPIGLRWNLIIHFLILISVAAGCNARRAQDEPLQVEGEEAVPSRLPTADEMYRITAPDYKNIENRKEECLGRLVFAVQGNFEWPTYLNDEDSGTLFNRSFGPNVASPGDTMRFGDMYIAVIASVSGVKKENVFESTPAALEAHLVNRISETRAYIDDERKNNKNSKLAKKNVEEAEGWILGWEKTIKEDRKEFEPFNPGLPHSHGYWTSTIEANDETDRYSVLRAYLTRGEHIYIFQSSARMKTASDKEAHKRDFSAMLAKFRTRAPNEIPVEPGVCFPFGFIPDDGRTVVEFKQSLRFKDAPAVLYTIETGMVHPRRLKPTIFMAGAYSSMNPPPFNAKADVNAVITQRIGPHFVSMGGVKGMQGGVVMKAEAKGIKYDVYDIYSGYSGWLGTAVLPYMLVEMQTVNMQQATELKQYPPPYEQSKERLDVMLKSMRWRPTNPPMSEFVKK